MLNKKLSLILLAAAAVVELTSLVWIRGEYRSTMIDGAEYQVPAAIDFKGNFYERNYLPVTVPLTEAPWHGEKAPEKGEEIYLALTRNADGMMEITGAQDTRPGAFPFPCRQNVHVAGAARQALDRRALRTRTGEE